MQSLHLPLLQTLSLFWRNGGLVVSRDSLYQSENYFFETALAGYYYSFRALPQEHPQEHQNPEGFD